MLVSNFAVCIKEKSRFFEKQDSSELLYKLVTRTPLANNYFKLL